MAEHTPGPWVAVHSDPAEGADCWWIVASSSNNMEKEVATVAGGYPQDRHEANANLIAASPYLYLALKLLLSAIAGAGSLEDARDVAEMALAKADTRVDS